MGGEYDQYGGGYDESGDGTDQSGSGDELGSMCGEHCPVSGCSGKCASTKGHGGMHICAAQMHQWGSSGGGIDDGGDANEAYV